MSGACGYVTDVLDIVHKAEVYKGSGTQGVRGAVLGRRRKGAHVGDDTREREGRVGNDLLADVDNVNRHVVHVCTRAHPSVAARTFLSKVVNACVERYE